MDIDVNDIIDAETLIDDIKSKKIRSEDVEIVKWNLYRN